MTWLQLRLDSQRENVETLEDLMLEAGAVAVTLEDNADQPILEPGVGKTPLWHKIRLTGLFPADADMPSVLASFPQEWLIQANQRVEILEDKDWEREWIKHYQPMQFGRRLWVCPSWLEPPDGSAVNLLMDPGLAFGTGTHPTTELCLRELDGMDLENATVVDYGCGSGILAMAALKLGAARALCVDNDPQALASSLDNAQRNQVPGERLEVAFPDQVDHVTWSNTGDVVIANILAGPLMELAAVLLTFLRPGGTLLLSGLLDSQAAQLCQHYADEVTLSVAGEKDGWVCLRGELKAS